MKNTITIILIFLSFGIYGQGFLAKEYIEPAIDSNYVLVSAADGVLTYAHKDSLNLALESILNTPANNGYFASWDSLNNQFNWVMQIATPTDSVVFNSQFAGDGTPSNPIALASQGASEGQIMTFDSGSWKPNNALAGGIYGGSGSTPATEVEITNTAGLKVVGDADSYIDFLTYNGASIPLNPSLSLVNGISFYEDEELDQAFYIGNMTGGNGLFSSGVINILVHDEASYEFSPSEFKSNRNIRVVGESNEIVETFVSFDSPITGFNWDFETGFRFFDPDEGEFRGYVGLSGGNLTLSAGGIINTSALRNRFEGDSLIFTIGRTGGESVSEFTDNSTNKRGIQYQGFGEDVDGDGGDYSTFLKNSLTPVGKVAGMIADSLINFTDTPDWLSTRLELNDITIDQPTKELRLILEGLSNDDSNTIATQATRAFVYGNSNSISGDQNFIAASDASFAGYDATFTFPQTSATKNVILACSGGATNEDADYNLVAASSSSYVTDGNNNTVLSGRNGRITNRTNTISLLEYTRPYIDESITTGSEVSNFSGSVFDNIGASQKIELTINNEHVGSGGQETFAVGSITLDTMAKGYSIEALGMMVVRDDGDESLSEGDTYVEKFITSATSDGTTASLSVFGETTIWATETENHFVGANHFDITVAGNTITFTCDPGDQMGTSDTNTIRSRIQLVITELAY